MISSSLGAVLRGQGFRVTAIKIDPIVNVDAGYVGFLAPFFQCMLIEPSLALWAELET
jgi:hypothetical protein